MPQVLVRRLDKPILDRLKRRARRHRRSLQSELKAILEAAAGADVLNARVVAARIHRALKGRRHADSGEMQRADRRR